MKNHKIIKIGNLYCSYDYNEKFDRFESLDMLSKIDLFHNVFIIIVNIVV